MVLRLEPVLAAKVEQWSAETGRPAGELVEDAIAGYFNELGELRSMLDRRYNEIAAGCVEPVDGVEARRLLKERAAARRKSIA
jgi:glutamate-1-semialdehyde aminotransferase